MTEIATQEFTLMPEDEMIPVPQLAELLPDERVAIDLETPLEHEYMQPAADMPGKPVARISSSRHKSFLVLDIREAGWNRDFLIVDETFSLEENMGYKGVALGRPVRIGRGHHTDRFEYPGNVSTDHFDVVYDKDGLFIQNLRPSNKTHVLAHFASPPAVLAVPEEQKWLFGEEQLLDSPPRIHDNRTHLAEERAKQYPGYGEKEPLAPYGYYLNHPILGRASQSVMDGVYLGGSAREAIVVDSRSVALQQVYTEAARHLESVFEHEDHVAVKDVLQQVMFKVQEAMPYSELAVSLIGNQYSGDKLVGLSVYVQEKAGVCRHQGLLAAYIVENLIKDGYLPGSIGIERNTVPVMGGTHAWAIYKNGDEEPIVIDPAQSFVGTKDEALQAQRWDYRLTVDEYSGA